MAILFTADHEAGTTAEWSGTFGTEPTVQGSPYNLNGNFGLRCNSGGNNEFKVQDYQANANSHHWFYCRIKIITAPSALSGFMQISKTDGSGVVWACRLNPDRTLQLHNGTTNIGNPTFPLNLNQTYEIEGEVDMTPASGSCIIRARVNGSKFAESAAETKNSYGRLLAGYGSGAATRNIALDNFIVNNTNWTLGDERNSNKTLLLLD